MRPAVLIALLCSAAALAQQGAQIGASAVWKPKNEESVINQLHDCGMRRVDGNEQAFADCVADVMEKAGASPAAVAFTRATGGEAYATAFRPAGRVDVVFAMNPFMANGNDQTYFVNGTPPLVRVDDAAMDLDITKDPGYAAILARFPKAFLFPHAESKPREQLRPGGGQRFLVDFPLVDGCHACARAGAATLAYDFDPQGNYLGATLVKLTPAKPAATGGK